MNGGLPSLSLLPPWVSDEVETAQDAPRYALPTLQWMAYMATLTASPCRSLALFFEGINFMDPRALDGGRGDATERRETCRAARAHACSLPFRRSEESRAEVANLRLGISVLDRDTQAIGILT